MILDVFNENYQRIYQIIKYSSVQYQKDLNAAGSFDIQIPLDDDARMLITSAKFILFEKEVCGIITYYNAVIDEETANAELVIKGYLMNSILSKRCFPSTVNFSGTTTAIVRAMVDGQCINTSSNRVLPLILSTNPEYIPASDIETIRMQVTGDTLSEAIESLLDAKEMGYDIVPILTATSISGFEFRVIKGKDRTIYNIDGNGPVLFSQDMRNLFHSEYTYNENDYKNTAYVAGEGDGASRVVINVGDTSSSGLNRNELYVDARDLQKDDGETVLTDNEYTQVLTTRGLEQLKECPAAESYGATINSVNSQYEYGVDYFLGDLVTIRDPKLGKELQARITQISQFLVGDKAITDVTFGYYKMSTAKKLKRNGVI